MSNNKQQSVQTTKSQPGKRGVLPDPTTPTTKTENLRSLRSRQASPDSKSTHDINALISDYLHKKSLHKTLEAFEREVRLLSQNDGLSVKLFQAFDAGNSREFFAVYNQMKRSGTTSKTSFLDPDRNEFFLYVYFVIFEGIGAQNGVGKGKEQQTQEAMTLLKGYLEERGSELAKSPDLVPFFAIPYVKNLKEHGSFRHLFAPSWAQQVRETLKGMFASGTSVHSELELALCSARSNSKGGNGHSAGGMGIQSQPDRTEEFQRTTAELALKSKELEEAQAELHRQSEESKEAIREIHQKWSTFVRYYNK